MLLCMKRRKKKQFCPKLFVPYKQLTTVTMITVSSCHCNNKGIKKYINKSKFTKSKHPYLYSLITLNSTLKQFPSNNKKAVKTMDMCVEVT